MPWIKEERLYPIIALLLILIIAIRTPVETDMWWHLRAGEETLHNTEVYSVDTFSFTREGFDWINHSWLSQVVMALTFNAFGYFGLSIWVGICAVLSMLFVYLQMKGHPLLRSAILLFAAVVSSVVWSPRPQIHSLVLFSILSYLILKFKQSKDLRYMVGALPVFILWSNLHGGYVLGIILMSTVAVGEILNKVMLIELTDNLSWRQLGIFIAFIAACLTAVLINPFGLDMWRIPFNTVGVETLQNVISEWASPDFHQPFQQPMLWMMLGAFSLAALSRKSIDGTELVPFVAFSWAALVARRNFGPFAIIAAPIFSRYLAVLIDDWLIIGRQKHKWIDKLVEKSAKSNEELKPVYKNIVNVLLISLLLIGVVWKIIDVNDSDFIHQAEKNIFPVDAVVWLKDSNISGKMFNDYNWGGYLIWHLREQPVFVDGRTDLYGDEILEDYIKAISGTMNWGDVLYAYDIDFMLVKSGSIQEGLIKSSGLEIKYEDDVAMIITR